MNRRGFLKGFVGAVAGAALAEELSTKSIFLPPRGGWVSDVERYYGWIQSQADLAFKEALAKYERAAMTQGLNAGIPQFLTNYVDPKVVDILVSPMKYQYIRKFL